MTTDAKTNKNLSICSKSLPFSYFTAFIATMACTASLQAQPALKKAPVKTPLTEPVPQGRVVTAQSIGLDQRLVVFPYDANAIYPVLTQVEQFTVFRLGTRSDSELIAGAYLGKTTLWSVEGTPDKKELRVKPNVPGIKDTLQIRTNVRDYFIDLRETSNTPKEGWMQRVSWDVPRPAYEDLTVNTMAQQGSSPNGGTGSSSAVLGNGAGQSRNPSNNTGIEANDGSDAGQECRGLTVDISRVGQQYVIKGDAPFAPRSPDGLVFDNGTHTFVRLPSNVQEIPAIFATDKSGQGELVNYRYVCGLYKIDRVVDYGLLLKLGTQEVSITKKTADCGWFGWGCSNNNRNINQ